VALAVGATLALAGTHARAIAAQEFQRPMPVAQPSSDVESHVEAIRNAPDPSAAIAAYADAKSVAPNSLESDNAFVHRMVTFGLPQMAETQAQTLVQTEKENGLAWGVLAYSRATRGDTTQALSDIEQAVKSLPDDAFVQRTAGQLVAWYDTIADQSKLSEVVKQSVEKLRHKLTGKRAYDDAYHAARSAYEEQTNAAETGPASAEVTPASPVPAYGGDTYNYNYDYSNGGYAYPGYVDYGVYPYYSPYPNYYGGYYTNGFWCPGPFSTVIVPPFGGDFFFRHRFFHHEPDLDDFVRFHGHRPFGFFDHDRRFGFFDHGRRFGSFNHERPFGGFVGRHDRGWSLTPRGGRNTFTPNRGFALGPSHNAFALPRTGSTFGRTFRTPQNFARPRVAPAPRLAPHAALAPRSGGFAAAGPRFGGGGSGFRGGGGGGFHGGGGGGSHGGGHR
jgi:hypothetical protein